MGGITKNHESWMNNMAHQWINDHWNNVASAGHHYFYGWDSNHPQTVVVCGSQVTSEKNQSNYRPILYSLYVGFLGQLGSMVHTANKIYMWGVSMYSLW